MVDLKEFGLGGIEPTATKVLREKVIKDYPDVFELMHGGDAEIKKYMLDPTVALREAKNLMAGRF